MKEIKIRKINFYKGEKYYDEYIFNIWEDNHIIYSNNIKIENQEIDGIIKYTGFIRQNKGCMISTSLFVEKDNYNIDEVVRYIGYYLIYNRLRIKYERLQSRLNSFRQIAKYIYKYNDKRDIDKFKRIVKELKNHMNKNMELMRLFNYTEIMIDITKNFSREHKEKFYLIK